VATDPLLFELEVRGYVPFELGPDLTKHVTAAVRRRGSFVTPNDLVLVVDRTQPDGLPGSAAAPHRTSLRAGPFSLPLEDVLALAARLEATFTAPLRRVTIVEIADVAPTEEDLRRLGGYTSPAGGELLVGAVYVDASGPSVFSNDGASPYTTGLVHADDTADIAKRAYGAPRVETTPDHDSVSLFSARAIGTISFLFSPVAGAALLAWNFHKTRRTRLGATLVASALTLVVAMNTASGALGEAGYTLLVPLNLGGLFALVSVARSQFGEPLKKGPVGLAVLLAVASLALFSLAAGAVALVVE